MDNEFAIGMSDTFKLTCTSILSILSPDMHTVTDTAVITFIDGSDSSGATTLDDGTVIVDPESDDGTTDFNTGPDCSKDKIMFLTDFEVIDYTITPSSGYKVMTPSLMQFMPSCPIECTLDENNSGTILTPSVFNVNPADGRISIKATNAALAADVQMKLQCTSIQSTNAMGVTTDEFIVALHEPQTNCLMDILDFTTKIPQKIDYSVEAPAQLLNLNPSLVQEIPGCPVTCTLGEVPSYTVHDTDVITFNDSTGEVFISTSQVSYQFTKMSLTITCTSDESIHMTPLRTVTDTFTVSFNSPDAADCDNSFDAYVFETYIPDYQQTYIISDPPIKKSIMPEFFALSMTCPVICTLHELLDGADSSQPQLLPIASDPSFESFNQFTGELVISTTNQNYAGQEINLIVECASSRQYGGFFSYPL